MAYERKTWAFFHPNARKASIRRLPEAHLVFLCWHGTPREKLLAEKEIRRRESSR